MNPVTKAALFVATVAKYSGLVAASSLNASRRTRRGGSMIKSATNAVQPV
jgi:hypothetical protein